MKLPITVITNGETRIYPTTRAAVAGLLTGLPNDELSPLVWLEVIRAELQRRTVVRVFEWEPPPTSRAASAVKPSGSASTA